MTTENIYFLIIFFVLFEFVVLLVLDFLNTLNWSTSLPDELKWIYDEEKYSKSMKYEKSKFWLWLVSGIINLVILLICILSWAFGGLFDFLYTYTSNPILITLYFFWIVNFVQTMISLPFRYYSTFVIEEKFWFNKMSKKLFFIDNIKSLLLSYIIWWVLLALITWIYTLTSSYFWFITCIVTTLFSIFSMLFYSTLIVPLFNKQTPLEEWDLRKAIENFANKVGFKIDNIFVIDWSKRSKKANAYFSWFWPKKRIVLYDTLINDMETDELVAVLAHEIGHYKKKHSLQMLAFSIIQTAIMFYIFWLVLEHPEVSYSMWSSHQGFALWMLAFAILFTPISMIFWILGNILSRKNEYQADNFALVNWLWKELSSWLIKLSRNNLSNLRPHPVYEFFHYSHPTILKRLKAIKEWK